MQQRNRLVLAVVAVLAAVCLTGCGEAQLANLEKNLKAGVSDYTKNACKDSVNTIYHKLAAAAQAEVAAACKKVRLPDAANNVLRHLPGKKTDHPVEAACLAKGTAKIQSMNTEKVKWEATCLSFVNNITADPMKAAESLAAFKNSTGATMAAQFSGQFATLVAAVKANATATAATRATAATQRLYEVGKDMTTGSSTLLMTGGMVVLLVGAAAFGFRRHMATRAALTAEDDDAGEGLE